MFAHVYLTSHDRSPNPIAKSFDPERSLYYRKTLTRYLPKKKVVVKKKLVGSKDSDDKEIIDKNESEEPGIEDDTKIATPIVSYWWQNLTVSIVPEATKIPSNIPPAVKERM